MIADHPYDDSEAGFGGIIQATAQFVSGVSRVEAPDVDFHLVAFSARVRRYETKPIAGGTLHYLPRSRRALLTAGRDALALIRLVRRLQRGPLPCVIHGNGTVKAILASLVLSRRHVQTVHGLYRREEAVIPPAERTFEERLRFPVKAWLERLYLRRVRQLIAISDEIAEEVRAAGGRPTVHRIENPVERSYFALATRREPPAPGPLSLLFIAAITRRKGLHVLIEAVGPLLAEGRVAEVLVVGRWDQAPGYVDALRARCARPPLDRVRFTGRLSTPDLMAAYGRADVLVLPSLAETKPMVIAQAHCAGLPVVATTVGGIPEMITDGITGLLVPPDDAPALGTALARLADAPDLRCRLAAAAQASAARRYDAGAVVAATFDVYRRLAREPERRPAAARHQRAWNRA
jgi:glycosyltransferase involved in cell wall biosynthesis